MNAKCVSGELLSLGAFATYWHTMMEFRPNAKGKTITMAVQMIRLVATFRALANNVYCIEREREWVVGCVYVCFS